MEFGASIFFTDYSITPAELVARMVARLAAACTAAGYRISRWVDRMAAAGLTETPLRLGNAVSPWEAGAPRSAVPAKSQMRSHSSMSSAMSLGEPISLRSPRAAAKRW
jgi:hypothetical protein